MTSTTDGATVLGVVDDWEYLGVEWVYRRPAGDSSALNLDYYCTRAAWPATPAALLAGRDQIIKDLRAKVAELEERLAAVTVPPAVAEAATGMSPPPADYVCPHCEKRCATSRGLNIHLRVVHGLDRITIREQLAEPHDGWRCAICKSDAFAPGLHNITICMRCEGTLESTNGIELAA